MSGKAINLTGVRFGRLVVQRREGTSKNNGQAKWLCLCDCGGQTVSLGGNLRSGHANSCGCLSMEHLLNINLRHGHASGNKTPEYRSWTAMRNRCNRKEDVAYHRYGGRGIQVCNRWSKFENFLADMGPRPEGKVLGRIDGNGNYTPANCKWETWEQQNNPDNKPYHSWLIKQRRYCDRCLDALTQAVTVRKFHGKDLVLCAKHAKRLDAVRQSERKQEIPQ